MSFFLSFIRILCQVLTIVIILRAVLSWFQISPTNIAAVILRRLTEPVLAPLRRIIPQVGMIDFSPMVAIIVLQLIKWLTYL